MPKNIALFIDGTWNNADKNGETNVHKLYQAALACAGPSTKVDGVNVACPGSTQVVHYIEGVGTGGSVDKYAVGGPAGFGTAARIREAYRFLALNYNPTHEDRVYIFGFSRGAFAARALAGFVGLVGLLFKEKASARTVARAYVLYKKGIPGQESALRDSLVKLAKVDERPAPIYIHFIGTWDTVKALGLPGQPQRWTRHYDNPKLPDHISHARHALALHDLRPEFEPTLWEDWQDPQSLKQVWFSGAHADVGGGYTRTELSDVALWWIARESAKYGLKWFFAIPLVISGVSSDTVHYETLLQPPAPRGILSGWRSRPPRMVESFFMHETACKQLLNATPRRYQFEGWRGLWKWVIRSINIFEAYGDLLAKVDRLTLDLHLALSFKPHNKKPIR